MKKLLLVSFIGLTACAQTPQESAAYRQFGMQMLGASAYNSAPSSNNQPCMYNAQANAYQTCFHITAGGQCAHYGGVCTP
tara:strand:- start:8008 stop:8247 length:240 start_codon:yes stop_codon:yes gene_type:complete